MILRSWLNRWILGWWYRLVLRHLFGVHRDHIHDALEYAIAKDKDTP